MGIFRTIVSTFILVIFIYISHQLTRFTDLTWWGQSLVIGFLAVLFSLVIGTFLYLFRERTVEHSPWKDRLLNGSLTVMAYINFLGSLVILRDLFAFADHFISSVPFANLYSTPATMALMGAPVFFILLGNIVVRWGPRVKKVPLFFENLPADFEGLRLVHITDLHIGASLPSSFVEKLVKNISELRPDAILFTGDILDGFADKYRHDLKTLGKLHAPLGIYYVPGNHEYYWNGAQSLQAFRNLGFHVLINEAISIHRGAASLQFAGIPDPAARQFQMEGPELNLLQEKLRTDSFKVLLSHQPSLATQSQKLNIDLQVSGHTHGGQFFPWNWLIVFFERYAKGHYHLGSMQLYVNQGTGYWGPQLRLGTYCEVAEIVLRKGDKKE